MPFFRPVAAFFLVTAAFAQMPANRHSVVLDGTLVDYEVYDGWAVTQGDIILGTVEEVEAAAAGTAKVRSAAIILDELGQPKLWPDATLYYEIDPNLSNPQRILDAIEHWNTETDLTILPRTGQENYVRFVQPSATVCSSFAGMAGGAQPINLAPECPTPAVIHEIGHAWGLMHEQSRPDRNQWVTVQYENTDADSARQFHQGSNAGQIGYYDYGSIMHYGPLAFSANGRSTILSAPVGIPLSETDVLSAGDIDGVERLYGFTPQQTTITTIPAGLTIQVDGAIFKSPQSFDWGPGSSHTVSVESLLDFGSHYAFVRWTDGGAQTHTVVASPEQTAIAAEFQESVPVLVEALGNGTVSIQPPSPDGYYPLGSEIQISATPAAGQQFLTWSGTPVEISGQGRSTPSPRMELQRSSVFLANFTGGPVTTVDSDPPGQFMRVDGQAYLTPTKFAWEPGTEHSISFTTEYSPSDGTRNQLEGWEDGTSGSLRTVTAGTEDATYTAHFSTSYYLSIRSAGQGFIDVSPDSPDGYFPEGTTVEITAQPFGARTVQYWLGDTSGGGEVKTLVMDGPRQAYAIFGLPLDFRPLNAASFLASPLFDQPDTAVAPLEVLTLFGGNLGPQDGQGGVIQNGALATTAAATRVLFSGLPAPIVYTSVNQTSVIVPAGVAEAESVQIVVERNGLPSAIGSARVEPTLPGIFTANSAGTGQIAALNQSGSFNGPGNGAPPGSVVVFYASGAGLLTPQPGDGAIIGSDLSRPAAPVYVRIGGRPAKILYAGAAPGLVNGVMQVNVRVPAEALSGEAPIQLIVGNTASPPGTTITIR